MESRQQAAELILAYESRRERIDQLLDRWAEVPHLAERDERLVRQTVLTYVARRRTVRFLLEKASGRQVRDIVPNLWAAVAVGAVQALFLERIPAHAAVNEAVDVARRWVGAHAARFANAVLRKLVEAARKEEQPYEPRSDYIPVTLTNILKLTSPWLPDFASQRVQHLGIAFSQPDWLVSELDATHDQKELISILDSYNSEPPIFLSVNEARTTPDALMSELGPDKAERTPLETTLRLVRGGDLSRLTAITEGLGFVQDISQAKVARKVPVEKAGRIVDACAAPGGKTLAALSRSRGKAFVVSADVSAERLYELAQALDRCGFPARCLAADARAFDRTFLEPFDVALADVPCSNTGVLRRRVDARWRVQPSDLTALTAWQLDLAAGAGRIVKRGGLLIYTTCSVLSAENEGVVKELVRKEGWVLVAQELILPGTDNGDGAFIAMLGKP